MIDKRAIKVALLLLMIFVAGGFCGWWIGGSSANEEKSSPPRGGGMRSPAAQRERLLNEFTTDLHMTSEQRAGVEKLLDEWEQDVRRINQQQVRGRYATFQKFSPLIRTNFTAEQQKIYDRITEQGERRWRRMMQNQ
jgi:hypothetical protein